jgi:hypothetical protein
MKLGVHPIAPDSPGRVVDSGPDSIEVDGAPAKPGQGGASPSPRSSLRGVPGPGPGTIAATSLSRPGKRGIVRPWPPATLASTARDRAETGV